MERGQSKTTLTENKMDKGPLPKGSGPSPFREMREGSNINPETGGGEVTVAGVGQQDNDGLALVLGTLGELDTGPDGSAGGDTDQHALAVADKLAGGKGVVIFDGDDLVIDLGIKNVRHKARADAWILCAPATPLLRTGDEAGSTATTLTLGFCSLRNLPVPVSVPPVPTPATKMSTCPSVSSQISGPVVS